MSDDTQTNPDNITFTDLDSFEAVQLQRRVQTGNVIKGAQVVAGGVRVIEIHDETEDHPAIIVRREGDRIDGIEFICKCGRSTSVKLEYDGE